MNQNDVLNLGGKWDKFQTKCSTEKFKSPFCMGDWETPG